MKTRPLGLSLIATVGFVTVLSLLASCRSADDTGNQTEAARSVVHAAVQTLQPVSTPAYAQVPGVVIASQEVQVASRLSGFIRQINVHEGQSVKQGMLLLTVDSSDLMGSIEQARANVSHAQASLANAESVYKRFRPLRQAGAISPQEFDKIRTQRELAQSQVAAARAALETARSRLQYAHVRAPIDGVVTAKLADVGDLATPGKPLLVLQNAAHSQAQFEVDEQTYRKLTLGNTVAVSTGMGYTPATVERLVPTADPVTHTHLVKAALPTGADLSPGTFVNVRIPVGTHKAIVVPASAVLQRAGIPGVFIVDAHNVAHYRMIRPGPAYNGNVVASAGLFAGDRIVTHPDEHIDNGVRVEASSPQGSKTPGNEK